MRNTHLIFADKFAVFLAAMIVLGTALCWALVVVAAGVDGANHVLASTGLSWVQDGLAGTAVLWVGLRGIDYLRGGPTRALFSTNRDRTETRHTLSVGNDLAHHHF